MRKPRRWRRAVLAGAALILAAGAAAPFLRADHWGPRIRESLERSLGRKVELGRVRLNLFTGPGFSVDNVVIHEDPAFGIEPVAYVATLDARVRLWALARGRLEFSNLRLVEPSVNLTRVSEGGWNFQQLLGVAGAHARNAAAARLPAIQVRSGRVNFKTADVKSVFYLSNADLDVYPAASGAEVRFNGEPARTDRGAQGFGRWSGRGEWRAATGEIALEVELKRSAIGEIVRLIHGHDVGLHGQAASRARVSGPLSNLRIEGRLNVESLYRWDQMPAKGDGWTIDYQGRLDLIGQELDLATAAPSGKAPPLGVRIRARNLFTEPRWGSAVSVDLPLAPLVELARHFGASLPPDVRVAGGVEGVVGFSKESGIQGKLKIAGARLEFPSGESFAAGTATLLVDRSRLFLRPAEVRLAGDRVTRMEAEYDPQAGRLLVSVAAKALPAHSLRDFEVLLAAPPAPFLRDCKQGVWRGWLRYVAETGVPPRWSAGGELRDARLAIPGLAAPLELASAELLLEAGRLELKALHAAAGGVEFSGEYRYEPKAPRPHQFRLRAGEVPLSAVETLFRPTLVRERGFLARTLRWRRPAAPDWLRERRAEGSIAFKALEAGGQRLERFRAHLIWDGVRIEIPELGARWSDGALSAQGRLTLASSGPRYEFEASLRNAEWRGGTVDAAAKLEGEGLGAGAAANLKASGSLNVRSAAVLAERNCRRLSAKYEFSTRKGAPRLRFSSIELMLDDELYQGKGGVQPDGRLEFELTSGENELRLAGTLLPFQLEAAPLARQQ